MKNSKGLAFAAAAMFVLTPPAWAGAVYPETGYDQYTHNGSDVVVIYTKDELTIRYTNPRSGLRKIGVTSGTTLFRGKRNGDFVEGNAFIFRKDCPPAPYHVVGNFDPSAELHLEGAVPRWDNRTCEITGYTARSANGRLIFNQAFGDF